MSMMQPYHDLMADVLENGQYKPNTRTGVGSRALVGKMIKYDLREGFPAITTKKLAFKAVKVELLGFFRGYQSAAQFRELGCNVWNANANETEAWLANPNRKGEDDLGRIYGANWVGLRDWREVRGDEEFTRMQSEGYELIAHDTSTGVRVVRREINQLELALSTLLKDPYDRGICVSAWRLDEFDQMALRPCHCDYRFISLPDGTLNMTLGIRSNDLLLGHPFNAASAALFLSIMARLIGREAGVVTVFITDAHVYENHFAPLQEQLSRDHFPPPKLMLSDRIRPITDPSQIRGVFERIEPDDITLEGYQSHAAISAPMAA